MQGCFLDEKVEGREIGSDKGDTGFKHGPVEERGCCFYAVTGSLVSWTYRTREKSNQKKYYRNRPLVCRNGAGIGILLGLSQLRWTLDMSANTPANLWVHNSAHNAEEQDTDDGKFSPHRQVQM